MFMVSIPDSLFLLLGTTPSRRFSGCQVICGYDSRFGTTTSQLTSFTFRQTFVITSIYIITAAGVLWRCGNRIVIGFAVLGSAECVGVLVVIATAGIVVSAGIVVTVATVTMAVTMVVICPRSGCENGFSITFPVTIIQLLFFHFLNFTIAKQVRILPIKLVVVTFVVAAEELPENGAEEGIVGTVVKAEFTAVF